MRYRETKVPVGLRERFEGSYQGLRLYAGGRARRLRMAGLVFFRRRARADLHIEQVPQTRCEAAQKQAHVLAFGVDTGCDGERGRGIAVGDGDDRPVHHLAVDAAEHFVDIGCGNIDPFVTDNLLQQRKGVAVRPLRGAGDDRYRVRRHGHALGGQHAGELLGYRRERPALKIELLAA